MKIHNFLVSLTCAATLAACGGGDEAPIVATVGVAAQAAGPTTGVLALTSAGGASLAREDFDGSAQVAVRSNASDLRAVLTVPDPSSGTSLAGPGSFLAARALDYAPGSTILLSPISTLADAYISAHPGITQQAAEAKVLAYLGLPLETVVNSLAPSYSSSEFDALVFYSAARAAGGMAALVQQSVSAIDAGQQRQFTTATRLDGLLGVGGAEETAFEIAESLAGDIDTWAGGKIKGWLLQVTGVSSLLDSLGLGDSDKNTQLLEQLARDLKALTDLVKLLPLEINWQTRLNKQQDLTEVINNGITYLRSIASQSPPTQADITQNFLTPLNSIDNKIQGDLHNNQVGAGEKDIGLIELLLADHPKYYAGYPEGGYDQTLYLPLNQANILQTQALQLKVEAAHGSAKPAMAAAENYADIYFKNLKQQRLMYPNAMKKLPGDSVLDRGTGLLWASSMYDFRGYDALITSLKDTGWRLPSVNEVIGLFAPDNVIAQLPADQRLSNFPQMMHSYGFKPETYPDGSLKHFADLGRVGDKPNKILNPGYVVTSDVFRRPTGSSDNYDVRVNVVNLYNAVTESVVLKNCVTHYNVTPPREDCTRAYQSRDAVVPWVVPVLLVRDAIVPAELQVTFDKGFDAATGLATAKASLRTSDGVWRDVTKEVIWNVSGAAGAHVSNSDATSGVVQYRGGQGQAVEFTVTADYPWYISGRSDQHGKLTSSAKLYGSDTVAAATLKTLIVWPGNSRISTYPLDLPLNTIGMMSNGVPVDQTDGITWSSSDPLVKFVGGHAQVAARPSAPRQIQITGTKNGATGFAYLVLE